MKVPSEMHPLLERYHGILIGENVMAEQNRVAPRETRAKAMIPQWAARAGRLESQARNFTSATASATVATQAAVVGVLSGYGPPRLLAVSGVRSASEVLAAGLCTLKKTYKR